MARGSVPAAGVNTWTDLIMLLSTLGRTAAVGRGLMVGLNGH